MSNNATKYSIRQRMLRSSGHFRENCYKLCIILKISEKTLLTWMNTKKEQYFSIPSDQLYIIADFLQCHPDDLMNHEQKAIPH